jgi:glycosyltransferase involved in cell wall biosynthesis
LAGDITLPKDDLKTTIGTYKYRDDVRLTGYLSTPVFARLLAGTYALVHTGAGRQLVVEAMCCGVPLIVADTDVLRYICGNAALYTNPDNVEDVAEQLMLIYKDENLRHRQIALGNIQVDPHRPPAAVDKLAEALLGTHALATATVV